MKIATTESFPILADNKTSITRGSAANSQGAKFESHIVLAFANLTVGQSLTSTVLRMHGFSEILAVFRPGTKSISEFLRSEVSKVDSLSALHIGDQKSFYLDHILFRRWVLVLFYCSFT